MEKKGVLLPLILAFFAASIYWWILSNKEKDIAKDFEMAQVLVAKYDLPARTIIKADLVETVEIPRRYIQKDAYEVRSAADIKMVVNLVSAIRIPKGNQVTQSALLALSPEAGLSVKVPPGLRGAVLPVDSDLLRLIKPGDRVDILVTFEAVMADGKKERVTATILQNVLVLGVGTNLGQGLNAAMAAAKGNKRRRQMLSVTRVHSALLLIQLKASIFLFLRKTEMCLLSSEVLAILKCIFWKWPALRS